MNWIPKPMKCSLGWRGPNRTVLNADEEKVTIVTDENFIRTVRRGKPQEWPFRILTPK